MKKIIYATGIIFSLFLGLIAGFFSNPSGRVENQNNNKEIIIRDTIEKIKYSEPIIITKVKTRIIKTSDSEIVVNPFVSKLDTIINKDTVNAVFEFPENLLSINFRKAPDTLMLRKIEIIRNNQIETNWWEVPLYITSGVLLGYIIGSFGK